MTSASSMAASTPPRRAGRTATALVEAEPMAAGVRELYPDRVDGLIDAERIGRTQRPLFTPGVRR